MRSHQGRTNQKQTGFTLVELLLALAIFAYSASTILNVVGTSSNNLTEIEQITFASWVANDQLIELQNSQVWPPKNKAKGEQELAGRKWYWQQIVVEELRQSFLIARKTIRDPSFVLFHYKYHHMCCSCVCILCL